MTRKTEAGLIAIGIVLALNAAAFVSRFIYAWVGLKPGIDYVATRVGPNPVCAAACLPNTRVHLLPASCKAGLRCVTNTLTEHYAEGGLVALEVLQE